jgi:hypothetical protein
MKGSISLKESSGKHSKGSFDQNLLDFVAFNVQTTLPQSGSSSALPIFLVTANILKKGYQ